MSDTKFISNFNKVCRVCLAPNDLNKSIFSCSHEKKMTFAELVMEYVPVQILMDDGLPTLICDSCLNTLESFLRLCEQCLISDNVLRQQILNNVKKESDLSIKIEDDSKFSKDDSHIDNLEDYQCSKNLTSTDHNIKKCYDYEKVYIKDENKLIALKQKQKTKEKKGINLKIVKTASKIHKRTSNTDRYQCEFCGKRFAQKCHFDFHTRTHTGERPFKCNVCQKSFAYKLTLKIHSVIHSGERPFSCEKCGKSFTQKCNLLTHMTVHTGEQRFSCEICSKRFTRKAHLVTHAHIHSGEKPYECSVCYKRFSQKYALKEHELIHSDKNPFECPTCGKSFSRKQGLNIHIKIHTGEKPFGCQTCGKLFGRKDKFTAHSKTHSRNRRDNSGNSDQRIMCNN